MRKHAIDITADYSHNRNTAYFDGSQLMSEIRRNTNGTTSAALLYSYDADSTLVSVNYNGTEYYYLRNGQNDVVDLVDSSGDTVVEYRYDAWGKLLSTTGPLASTLGEDNPIRYRRYYYDTETGLYYLQSRYYDPDTGRFINADDVAFLGATGTTLSCNLFAYCENNPSNCNDPYGYGPVGTIVGGILGFGLGALLVPRVADLLKLKELGQKVFILAGVAALTGLGAYVGNYIGEAIFSVYKAGGAFALKINQAIANGIAKVVGGSIKAASGNGWGIKIGKLTLRIMTSGGGRTNYFRLSHITKRTLTILGAFSGNRALTHIPITFNNIIKIVQLIFKFK